MPILPHRLEAVELVPGGPTWPVHFVHDTPVAYRRYGEPTVFENPFPPDDPRHALTAELLDLIQGTTPERPRRRQPWHPDILIEEGTRWLAGRESVAAQEAALVASMAEYDAANRERRNRRQRERRAAARAGKVAAAAQDAVVQPAG